MTVFPQQFTLNCVKIGTENFNYSLYFKHGTTVIANAIDCYEGTNCTIGHRTLQDVNDNAFVHSVSLTWDTAAVSSSSFNKLFNGDHEYQCEIIFGINSNLQTVKVKGNIMKFVYNQLFDSISTSNCSIFSYCGQQNSYHYHCQLDST